MYQQVIIITMLHSCTVHRFAVICRDSCSESLPSEAIIAESHMLVYVDLCRSGCVNARKTNALHDMHQIHVVRLISTHAVAPPLGQSVQCSRGISGQTLDLIILRAQNLLWRESGGSWVRSPDLQDKSGRSNSSTCPSFVTLTGHMSIPQCQLGSRPPQLQINGLLYYRLLIRKGLYRSHILHFPSFLSEVFV